MYDEVHEVEDANEQQDYRGPVTRSRTRAQDYIDSSMGGVPNRDEEVQILKEGIPILIHIEKYEGGPILGTFLQQELIDGCVQEYPVPVDTLNEYECIVHMMKRNDCKCGSTGFTKHDTLGGGFMLISSAP